MAELQKNSTLCRHVAIIMDGNGRWAKKNKLARTLGHRAGAKTLKEVVKAAIHFQLEALTVYAFSTENWRRPQEEVSFLMDLFIKTLETELTELHQAGVKIDFIGHLKALPESVQKKLTEATIRTADNHQLTLTVAINYGSRYELVEMCQALAKRVAVGELSLCDIDEGLVSQSLALSHLPAIDLLIRTSGEMRLSNFLLWQLAYSELYFVEVNWPDFKAEHFKAALVEFERRERRYGGI